jgi:hypothetical protein
LRIADSRRRILDCRICDPLSVIRNPQPTTRNPF